MIIQKWKQFCAHVHGFRQDTIFASPKLFWRLHTSEYTYKDAIVDIYISS